MHEFKLPDLGEGVHEGQVMKLLVRAGESIREDQPLMEVETDKAAVEIPSPHSGVVSQWHVEEGQVVNVGDVMVTFDRGSAAAPARPAAAQRADNAQANGSTATATVTAAPARRKPASPAVRRLARELGIDLAAVPGSGPGGRITRSDVQNASGGTGHRPVNDSGGTDVSPVRVPATHTAETAVPPVRRRDTATLAQPVVSAIQVDLDGTEDTDTFGPIIRQSMSQARRTIANVMSEAMRTIPHVTDCDDADITELERMRKQYNAQKEVQSGATAKLSTLPFVIRAVVRALQAFPLFNAAYDEQRNEIVYKRYYNIAIGVQTQRGLIAPVIRDADRLTIAGIADQLNIMAENARTASFAVGDTRGGTYTISNAGAMGGSRYSTPIITPGQVAVLALGKSRWMPWVVQADGAAEPTLQPRFIMPLSHSMDHRVIDGAIEIAFMRQIISDLETPMRLMM